MNPAASRIIFLTLAACALCSCSKELDFEYHYIPPLTVIEGELTPAGAKVGITLTTPMGEPMDRTRLTDATVTLTDLTTGLTTALTPDSDGFFRSSAGSTAGRDYRLSVSRGEATYEADAGMFGPVTITGMEFSWIRMPYDYVAALRVRFTGNPADADACYWIKLLRNGEIYSWGTLDSRAADASGTLTYIAITSRRDTDEEDDATVLFEGDVMTAEIAGISAAMRDYLEALANDSSGPAMFAGPRCLGYFCANSPASRSVTFHPTDLPIQE